MTSRIDRRSKPGAQAALLAALQSLLADGASFSSITVEDLTTRAGKSRSSFYAHFPDMATLLRAGASTPYTELNRAAQTWWSLGSRSRQADLEAALSGIVDTYRDNALVIGALYDAATVDTTTRRLIEAAVDEWISMCTAHFELGRREHWVRNDLHARETATIVVWMLERGLDQLLTDCTSRRRRSLIAGLADWIWHAVYHGGS